MNAVKNVFVNRAEGLSEECGAVVFYTGDEVPVSDNRHYADAKPIKVTAEEIIEKVSRKFLVMGLSAPKGGGYDKVDFTVEWDGTDDSYTGRFDMEYGGTDAGEPFWSSLKNRIKFYACERRPSHFNDENWAKHVEMCEKEGYKEEMTKVLAECAM